MANLGKKVRWSELKYHWPLYLFVIPTIVFVAIFLYYPASSGIFHSLYRWNGADISEWVGFDNFIQFRWLSADAADMGFWETLWAVITGKFKVVGGILSNTEFWRSFEVAFTCGVWSILKIFPAMIVAVCLTRVKSSNLQFFYRVMFVIQMVIPGLIMVLIWRTFFLEATNGFLNRFLEWSHLFDGLVWIDKTFNWGGIFVEGQRPAWLGDPRLLLTSCIIWGFPWVGSFSVLNYLSRLQNIPKDIYEAADLDGVSFLSKFTQIEFPLITESLRTDLVFVIINTIKDAGMVLALAGMMGGPGGVVTVPALFMLRKAFLEQDMGYACAIGLVLTLILFLMQKATNMISSWNDFKPLKRFIIRMCFFVLGLYLLLGLNMFIAVGWLLVVACAPYEIITESYNFIRLKVIGERKDGIKGIPPESVLFRRRMVGWFLIFLKHFFIWFILMLSFIPLIMMFVVSLKDNNQFYLNPIFPEAPFHWENWPMAWKMVLPSLANSLTLSISVTIVGMFFAMAASYFFARHRMPMSTFLWNAIIILLMIPAVANMVPLFTLLRDMNLLNTLTALVLIGAANAQVANIFVLRTFVEDIPRDLFEAAEIDGANHFQQMMIVVLPLAGPILGTLGVIVFMQEWGDFVMPLIILRDQESLTIMVTLMRISGEYIKLWGPLMAGYAFASLPVCVLFVFTMKLFTKGLTEGGVKQ